MADQTSNTVFGNSTDPQLIYGKTNAANGDTFYVNYGKPLICVLTSVDDNDAMVSTSISGKTITITAKDDTNSAITSAFNINFMIVLGDQ